MYNELVVSDKAAVQKMQEEAHTSQAKLFFGSTAFDTTSTRTLSMARFIENIQTGEYQDHFLKIAKIEDKSARQVAKRNCPLVCVSGYGGDRTNEGITLHSGFAAIDIDDEDVIAVKKQLQSDPYVYALFVSISGKGLCVIVKIDAKRHLDAMDALQDYFLNNYGILIDEQCKNIGRARYVSYDPELIYNEASKIFKEYLKKEPAILRKQKSTPALVVNSDFENIILREIEEQRIDLVPDYQKWRNTGFALVDAFGSVGENYYHTISQFGRYDRKICSKQYNACLKANERNKDKKKKTTINYFYTLCKDAGIAIKSEQTSAIEKSAYTQKTAGVARENVVCNLQKYLGFAPDITTDIVNQVFDKNIIVDNVSDMECIREYLKANYTLRINEITNHLENDGKELTNYEMHSIELAIREKFPRTDYTTIGKILDSNFIPKYHPIFEFFKKYHDRGKKGSIAKLFQSIKTTTGGDERSNYAVYFGTKWLVGMIAGLYCEVNPLMLVLCGQKQGTGKTYFFENFLPDELKRYSSVKHLSSLSNDTSKRDMDIAVSRYWLIYDDEMAGKSKRDHAAIKALLSLSTTNVRAAYAKREESRKRIAAFGGTTNDTQLLSDHTGNRRIIPIEVDEIDFEAKDRIDPIEYIMEAYHLYQGGEFDFRVLGKDVKTLEECTPQFKAASAELELVTRYYKAPTKQKDGTLDGKYVSATDIRSRLQTFYRDNLDSTKITAALKSIGIERDRNVRVNGQRGSWYKVVEKTEIEFLVVESEDDFKEKNERLPF